MNKIGQLFEDAKIREILSNDSANRLIQIKDLSETNAYFTDTRVSRKRSLIQNQVVIMRARLVTKINYSFLRIVFPSGSSNMFVFKLTTRILIDCLLFVFFSLTSLLNI